MSNKKSCAATLIHQLRHFIAGVILYNQRVAAQLGMNPTDMQCIHLLDLMGPLTPGKLAESTGLTTGGVTVVLDRLEKAGLTRRERNPQDRRSVVIHLQPGTLEGMEAQYRSINEQMAALLAQIPERDLKTVLGFFSKLNSIRATSETDRSPGAKAPASKLKNQENRTWHQEPKNALTPPVTVRSGMGKNTAARRANPPKR
ncbi:MAG TPA: MarR family transcriptional regulator [Silvibacterium sp.]|nr:MarR family transcriptional regulator [Silvibacterium sp.]